MQNFQGQFFKGFIVVDRFYRLKIFNCEQGGGAFITPPPLKSINMMYEAQPSRVKVK